MKVMLIGKNGQVGREIVAAAPHHNIDLVGFTKKDLDITNYRALKNKVLDVKPDVLINTAAFHIVPKCETQLEKAFGVNVFASKILADTCREVGVRMVTFSSDKVFDGRKRTPYREDDAPNPIQIYGITKYARERISLEYNPNTLVIRTCGIFGGKTGSRSKKGNFVLYVLSQAKEKKRLEISSEQIVSFANATDLAEGVLSLLKKKNAKGVFHIVNEGYASWAAFAKAVVGYAGLDMEIVPVNRGGAFLGMKIPKFAALENTRAKDMGIELPHWRDGLKRYLSFLQNS